MLKVFSLFLILFSINKAFSCKIDSSKKILSFSAPVTHLLEKLSLVEDPSLEAISIFHPVKSKKVERIAGGIFLSPKYLKEKKDHIVFFDESRELERALKKSGVSKRIELATRGLDPFEANKKAEKTLLPYLQKCESALEKISNETKSIKSNLEKSFLKGKRIVFFLGVIKKDRRPPRLVISNDGFVIALKKYAKIKTYPSELAYASRSTKILENLKPFISIGVSESDDFDFKAQKESPSAFNLSMAGALSPGWKQIEFLKRILSSNLKEQL